MRAGLVFERLPELASGASSLRVVNCEVSESILRSKNAGAGFQNFAVRGEGSEVAVRDAREIDVEPDLSQGG